MRNLFKNRVFNKVFTNYENEQSRNIMKIIHKMTLSEVYSAVLTFKLVIFFHFSLSTVICVGNPQKPRYSRTIQHSYTYNRIRSYKVLFNYTTLAKIKMRNKK